MHGMAWVGSEAISPTSVDKLCEWGSAGRVLSISLALLLAHVFFFKLTCHQAAPQRPGQQLDIPSNQGRPSKALA